MPVSIPHTSTLLYQPLSPRKMRLLHPVCRFLGLDQWHVHLDTYIFAGLGSWRLRPILDPDPASRKVLWPTTPSSPYINPQYPEAMSHASENNIYPFEMYMMSLFLSLNRERKIMMSQIFGGTRHHARPDRTHVRRLYVTSWGCGDWPTICLPG